MGDADKKKVYGKIHHSYRDNTKDTFIRFPGTFICIGYSNSLTNQQNPPKKKEEKRIQERRDHKQYAENGINFSQRIETKFICYFKSLGGPTQHQSK